ncbi:MAG: 4Fe-4S dicluster domain-containing protein [Thermodesulfobacteriota bacterium]|nr:4Fe-4S dicluster domain-containing protein [Thermodesulfobacteriota bacterium]
MKGLLIDLTRCIGCRACQVACKQWNSLSAEKTGFFKGKGYENPGRLSSRTWTVIKFNDIKGSVGYDWVFSKRQCFHCIKPSCVSVCPVSALNRSKSGAVLYNSSRCLGCRYCQMACPFNIPCFDWDKAIPEIRKCTLCVDRTDAGMEPACSKTCPTDAIVFGDRDDLIKNAEKRIIQNPAQYVNHIYGRHEVGGTGVLYLSSVPFEKLGFRIDLPKTPIAEKSRIAMESIPYLMTGLGTILGFLAWIINRRIENEKRDSD